MSSVYEASRPFMAQAEDDLQDAEELGRRVHALLVDTSGRFAEDEGDSRDLAEALEHLIVAEKRTWKAISALRAHRAIELWADSIPMPEVMRRRTWTTAPAKRSRPLACGGLPEIGPFTA